MGLSGFAILIALGAPVAAPADESSTGRPDCPAKAAPDWRRLPMRIEDYRHAYPREALRKGVSGRAVLDCKVSSAHLPADCKVDQEEPAQAGFGEAAIKLSRFYRFRLPCPGEPESVKLPISFQPPR